MNNNVKKDIICNIMKYDCLNLMKEKNISFEDLSYKLGISEKEMFDVFNDENDFIILLRTYNILSEA